LIQEFQNSLCNDLKFNIKDNDVGAIFDSTTGLSVVSTFGTEIMTITNESGTSYGYITIAYVNNPSRTPTTNLGVANSYGSPYSNTYATTAARATMDYNMTVYFTDLQNCAARSCPAKYSLTGGANISLLEGQSFGNGAGPRTQIGYLPGKYGKICLDFFKPFPAAQGKSVYCRTIAERALETGSPTYELPVSAGSTQGGWT
jgi:hypothetical protein